MRNKDELMDKMLAAVSADVDKSEGSFVFDAVAGVGNVIEDIYLDMELQENRFMLDTAVNDDLDAVAAILGVTRKPSTHSTTRLTVTVLGTVMIPKGSHFYAETEAVFYTSTEDVEITGNGLVPVVCQEAGTVGNVPANAIVNMVDPPAGFESVTNDHVVTNGYEAEGDEEYRQRIYDRARTPATSGNAQHYLNWAREVTGVGDAKVFPLWNGNGTVKVVIVNSNKRAADEELVKATFEHIEASRPIGAAVMVESAVEKSINVSVKLVLDGSTSPEQAKEAIQAALSSYLQSIVFKRQSVSYAIVGATILDVDGILDYSDLTINGTTSNIALGDLEIPIVGDINVT